MPYGTCIAHMLFTRNVLISRTFLGQSRAPPRLRRRGRRKGTNGVGTNGVTANVMFSDFIAFAAAPLVLTPFVRNQN